ncbi:MAG: Gfo/Idh/MocA family protein [Puniceicoccaceae bacterium]
MKPINLAVFGCGDFLRWQSGDLKRSRDVRVAALFDPDTGRARRFAADLGGEAVADGEAIFADPAIDAVALFVPPWVRKPLFLKAARAGKHILATKPLGAYPADCDEMSAAAGEADVKGGVIYSRTGDPAVEALKNLFESGEYGRLALYRHDWLHAYPRWNDWATDPEKNGGPFMDAMIHNLNAACYLMGRPVAGSTFFSDRLAHPELKCADTESMVVRFEGGGLANCFITWAADLASNDTSGNNREHIDIFYCVTDRGHHISLVDHEGRRAVRVTREGSVEFRPVPPVERTPYDAFAAHLAGEPFPRVLATFAEAGRDIRLVRRENEREE